MKVAKSRRYYKLLTYYYYYYCYYCYYILLYCCYYYLLLIFSEQHPKDRNRTNPGLSVSQTQVVEMGRGLSRRECIVFEKTLLTDNFAKRLDGEKARVAMDLCASNPESCALYPEYAFARCTLAAALQVGTKNVDLRRGPASRSTIIIQREWMVG